MVTGNDAKKYLESPVKPVEPSSMSVNMTYDPGPLTQAERDAARTFIDLVGGINRAKQVLRIFGELHASTR